MEPLTPRKMPLVKGNSQPTPHFIYGDREALQARGTETLLCKSAPRFQAAGSPAPHGDSFP